MATPSTMLELGTEAPAFALPDVKSGITLTRDDVAGPKGLLVMFISRHCPFVKHVQRELAKIGKDYARSGLGIAAICSNDAISHPVDAPEGLQEMAEELGFVFPYLYDESQAAAKAYMAACTPDFFLFDSAKRLVYRGQLDDSRPGKAEPVDGHDLRGAIDAVLSGRPVSLEQRPSLGCSIKWKAGNAPAYFAR